MAKEKIYYPSKETLMNSLVSQEEFEKQYKESIENPSNFWAKQARDYLDWDKEWEEVLESNIPKGEVSWFKGAKLNATVNCIDRHLPTNRKKTAIIWEGDDPKDSLRVSYEELHESVCRFANALKQRGIKKAVNSKKSRRRRIN